MTQFAESLKQLRTELNFSMQALADKAGVSKSMICKIERDEVQPTLDVAARLAKALGKTLSELLHTTQPAQIVHIPRNEQAVWEDSAGIKRRNISPVFEGLKVEWLEVELPPGAIVNKSTTSLTQRVAKTLLVKRGELKVIVNEEVFLLKEGDSLYFEMNVNHDFCNETNDIVQFYVVLNHAI